jgi:16S rRNA (cytidine1402-2'-O)-methyltransferase
LREALHDVRDVLGDRTLVIAREVTKLHEEFLRGHASVLLADLKNRDIRGEFTVIVAPEAPLRLRKVRARPARPLSRRVAQLQRQRGLDLRGALKIAAREHGLSRDEAYRRLQEERSAET